MAAGSKLPGTLRAIGSLVWEAFQEWVRDRCPGLAAALAYNALLMAASFFAAVLVLASRVFGEAWARAYVLPPIIAWLGPPGAAVAQTMLLHIEDVGAHTLFTLSVAGAFGLVYGAEGLFLQIQDSLETIWNVRREVADIRVQLRKRLLGLLYVLVCVVIALAGFVAAGTLFSHHVIDPAGLMSSPWRTAGNGLIAFATFWAVTTFWFKVLPPVRLTWRQILPWTALIAALHVAGRGVVMWIGVSRGPVSQANIGEAIVLVMLWFQYAGMVFLYGGQLMKIHLERYAGVLPPQEQGKDDSLGSFE